MSANNATTKCPVCSLTITRRIPVAVGNGFILFCACGYIKREWS